MNLSDHYIKNVWSTHNPSDKHRSLTDIYKSIYTEDTQQELPGIAPGSGEDSHVAVFYVDTDSLSEEDVAKFRSIGGQGPIHIPADYFSKVERRFRGKTIESLAHEWIKISTKDNKVDNLAYESLLNKLFDSDIKGSEDLSELKQFVNWKKNENDSTFTDDLHVAMSEETSKTIDFNSVLSPVVSHFIASDPREFIIKLWNITEQSKRVGVGKGEIAMSLLSRGYKGEPGDVKFDQNREGVRLAIEVKGIGGRPGKENYAHRIRRSLQELVDGNVELSNSSIEDIQSQLYPSTLSSRWNQIYSWFDNTLRNKKWVRESSGDKKSSTGDVIKSFLLDLEILVFSRTDDSVEQIAKRIRTLLKKLETWLKSISPDPNNSGISVDMYDKLLGTGTGGIAHYVHSTNMLRDISFISKLPSWQHVVTAFFVNIAKDMEFDENMLAKALVETRSDVIKDNAVGLESAIANLLVNEGKDVVYSKETLGKIVAAIQITAYCVSDGFNRALFINDRTLMGRSVPTYPDDVEQTLNNVYTEFISNDYKIDMGIDTANKGVQITYNG